MFSSLKNPRGQSALEFSALIIFVMMAVLIGGPYVVRSINSHFKSLEEGAIDSERETITEKIPNERLPICTCNPAPACGNGTVVGGVVCAKTRRIFQQFSCLEPGCYNTLLAAGQIPAPYCGDDLTNTCCEDRVNAGCANDPANRYTDASGVIQRRCPNNSQRVYTERCGSPVPITNYYCVPDSTCDYQCQTLASNASWCQPNDVLRHQNLPSRDFPVTYVAYGSSCPGTDHCEARCNSGYTPTAGGCTLVTGRQCGCGNCPNAVETRYAGWNIPATGFPFTYRVCKLSSSQAGLEWYNAVAFGGWFSMPSTYSDAVICHVTIHFCAPPGATAYPVGGCPIYYDPGFSPADACWEIIQN